MSALYFSPVVYKHRRKLAQDIGYYPTVPSETRVLEAGKPAI